MGHKSGSSVEPSTERGAKYHRWSCWIQRCTVLRRCSCGKFMTPSQKFAPLQRRCDVVAVQLIAPYLIVVCVKRWKPSINSLTSTIDDLCTHAVTLSHTPQWACSCDTNGAQCTPTKYFALSDFAGTIVLLRVFVRCLGLILLQGSVDIARLKNFVL